MVETLAYAADHLSYYQDAVATEAYLGTARKRVSVRRHARLLDYRLHEGCNARSFIHFDIDKPTKITQGTKLLTQCAGQPSVIKPEDLSEVLSKYHPEIFETMHDITLYPEHNKISFYTWSDDQCCLPKGATSATLIGPLDNLKQGDVLIFEEKIGPETGLAADADPAHRHAVRLTSVTADKDKLTLQDVVEIKWDQEDALPFALCISAMIEGKATPNISVARGNVALADHGQTLSEEALEAVPESGVYYPSLNESEITHAVPYDDKMARGESINAVMVQNPQEALPVVTVTGDGERWTAKQDLLNSNRFAAEFVVEMENDAATLRFGDDILGKSPNSGATLIATYRVGNGATGNVGGDTIAHVVTSGGTSAANSGGILAPRNPLQAAGGIDPESIEEARLYAPQAFRRQERAVTEADYATMAERHPEVTKAVATRRWTGSWYTMFITVDRINGQAINETFENELRGFLERYRMMGHDLEIDGPQFVSLEIEMHVCLLPGYFQSDVQEALLETFSSIVLADGRLGFFHPDNFTFGQTVYLSKIVAEAMAVLGVLWVNVTTFQRQNEASKEGLDAGKITMERLQIARLENNPSLPENGKIKFVMEGGE
jgi:hypothetical protein